MVALQRSLALWPFLLMLGGQSFPALAQVVPDATLGADSSQVQVQGNQVTIGNGASRGAALFHSFDQFNVADGQQVLFASPQGIEAILGRVTGSTASNINGTLGVLGAADLFLLNPNGVVFGPNAQLALSGSFSASTADDVQVGDITFSATAPDSVPLLSVNVSPGIQFGANDPNRLIQNQGTLALGPQQQLRLEGGTVNQAGQIIVPGGTVELRGDVLSLTGFVNTRTADNQLGVLRLSSPADLTIAAMAPLSNLAIAQALQTNGVVVESDRNLSLVGALISPSPAPLTLISGNDLSLLPNNGDGIVQLNGSATLISGNDILIEHQLFVTSLSFFPGFVPGIGGIDLRPRSLTIQADGDIRIRDTADTTRNVLGQQSNMLLLEGNQGDQGKLSIQANSLTMETNGFVRTDTGVEFLVISSTILGGQRGGDIDIVLAEDLTLIDNSAIFAIAGAGQDSGNLSVDVGGSVQLIDPGSNLITGHYGPDTVLGKSGDINVRAGEAIVLRRGGIISTQSFATVGDIVLTAPHIILDGSERPTGIGAGTTPLSPNDAGTITLNASESIELIGNQPDTTFFSDPQNVTIDDLLLQGQNSAVITTTAAGTGESGSIEVNTPKLTLRQGAGIVNAIGILGDSSGTGSVVINAGDIHLLGASNIANGTLGSGDGGRLEINSDRIRLDDSSGIGVSSVFGTGDAGELIIRTDDLVVTGGSVIAAHSDRGGGSGLLDIQAQSITVEGTTANGQFPSSLLTDVSATSTGAGGPLTIRTGTLNVLNGGQIRASTQGSENAGNLNIIANRVTVDGSGGNNLVSTIEAESTGTGVAGNIVLSADRLTVRDRATVSTQSLQGSGGDIALNLDESLLLRRQGTISATAGVDGTAGDGGNITIDASFVVGPALENSDITANAFLGTGGNITVRTNALLGIDFRDALTPLSDITASSEAGLDGTVVIEQFVDEVEPDPIELPENLVNDGDRLTAGCLLDENASFVATGRGGIPADPGERLNQALTWSDPRAVSEVEETSILEPGRVVEAQGWQVNEQGKVELMATANSAALSDSLSCQQIQNNNFNQPEIGEFG